MRDCASKQFLCFSCEVKWDIRDLAVLAIPALGKAYGVFGVTVGDIPLKKIFEVEVSNGSSEGYKTAAVLEMPCTQAEFRDALQKARVQDVKTCENELTRIRYPGITADMIGRNVDLLELNLLAVRLTTKLHFSIQKYEGSFYIDAAHSVGPNGTAPTKSG